MADLVELCRAYLDAKQMFDVASALPGPDPGSIEQVVDRDILVSRDYMRAVAAREAYVAAIHAEIDRREKECEKD